MRYKFRGMDVNGNWYYGNLAIVTDKRSGAPGPGSYISNSVGCPFAYQVRPETVGQFTGLRDKYGVGIYEGDIIKSIRGYKAVVEWADDGRFLGFTIERERKIMYVGQEPAVEIIGSIHSNPELLEVRV